MPLQELGQAGNDFADAERDGNGDAQDASQFPGSARRVIGLLERGQERFDPREIVRARFRQLHRVGRPDDQRGADLLLEPRENSRHRRLRQAKLASGARETPALRRPDKGPQCQQAISHLLGK